MSNTSLGSIAQSSSTARKSAQPRGEHKPRDLAAIKRFALQRHAARLLPSERIVECMVRPVPMAEYIVGKYNPNTESAHFSNLKVCDSYACPVCASRKAENDRRELSVALAQATKLNLFPLLCTLTMSHHMGERLTDTRKTLADCFDAVFSGGWYQRFKTKYRIVGKIKAWETTYGRNGWHPHLHTLFISELEFIGKWVDEMQQDITVRWLAMLERRGFSASWAHGVDVRTAQSDIADYIAKFGREPIEKTWGVDSELARLPAKKAASGGLTPIEILSASNGDTEALEHLRDVLRTNAPADCSKFAGDLYREYFYAFKGKPRLYWSVGLKDLLLLEQALIDFEENSPDNMAECVDVFMIAVGENWRQVTGGWNKPDLRGELLEVLRTGDSLIMLEWFRSKHIPAVMLGG